VRTKASEKATEIRRQGFSGAAMLPYSELEYGGIVKILKELDEHFVVKESRAETAFAHA
jgi:fructose 1,6-bisphosphate aldolase/phosphatase